MIRRDKNGKLVLLIPIALLVLFQISSFSADGGDDKLYDPVQRYQKHKHAYATAIYMGTARDYEFYIATRVMLRSLIKLNVQADLLVIASLDVPIQWVHALEREDGAKVLRVPNIHNSYKGQPDFDNRFKLKLNKLYAWSLVQYDRIVVLDSDNLFIQKTDELFQCGQFCAVFINPCIFHTGLFVLQPSMEVFKKMLHELEIGRENGDGADQSFLVSYFSDLLNMPMFHPPTNGTRLDGKYRLPLGYQMDASYYYVKLRWSIPCGPNSVITFPGAPWLKPWYWWSWPVLPLLGLLWHERRLLTLGYGKEQPLVLIQLVFYLALLAVACFSQLNLSKLCCRHADHKNRFVSKAALKMMVMCSILATYVVPFLLIPRTLHPLQGWVLYLLGSSAFSFFAINLFMLPAVHVLMPWFGICGGFMVMALPWYSDGIVRALAVLLYAFCCSPIIWGSLVKVLESLQVSRERNNILLRLIESPEFVGFYKLY